MAPCSMDLRMRVSRDSHAGMPSKDVAAKYAVTRARRYTERASQLS
jgi:hypothetical protein